MKVGGRTLQIQYFWNSNEYERNCWGVQNTGQIEKMCKIYLFCRWINTVDMEKYIYLCLPVCYHMEDDIN